VRSGIRKVVIYSFADTILVQNVCHTSREETKGSAWDGKRLANFVALISEDGKVESQFLSKLLFGRYVLATNANKFSTESLTNVLDLFIEGLSLNSATLVDRGAIIR
jgi:hypothetical protein